MPKIDFPMPTAKNRFQILDLHPKKHISYTKQLTVYGKVLLRQWLTREAGWRFFNLLCVIIMQYNYVQQTVSCIRFFMNTK